MKKTKLLVLAGVVRATFSLGSAEPETVDFDSERWTIEDPDAEVMLYMNETSLYLVEGVAIVEDVVFENGVIEVDVAAHGNPGFAGIVFRYQPGGDHEEIYLRPHRSGLPDAVQYTPVVHGSAAWQLYSGPGYTAAAFIPANRWVHLEVVVSGHTAKVFVNRAPEPDLVVEDLKNGVRRGAIGLWGRYGAANFANFRYTLAPSDGTTPRKPQREPSPGAIRQWSLSEALAATETSEDTLPPDETFDRLQWIDVQGDPEGLVNISRYRAKATSPKSVAFAKTTIRSDRDQVKKLSFGYSDEVSLFLNGQIRFTGDSTFRSRDPGFLGIVGIDHDAIYLSLEKGDNELVLAVRETFGGWGFICRLDDVSGVTLE